MKAISIRSARNLAVAAALGIVAMTGFVLPGHSPTKTHSAMMCARLNPLGNCSSWG